MKKSHIGYAIIIAACVLPIILLFARGPSKDLSDYRDATHAIGQLTALIGVILFALTFVLSTRLRVLEGIFGGLDKVYKVHILLGSLSLVLLLFHPLFLVMKFLPQNAALAASYLSWSSHWSVNYGIIALVGMILLIYLTFFSNLKYHLWKFSHEFMGLFFIIAVLHIFLVRDSVAMDSIFEGYYVFCIAVSAIGIAAFIYSLIIRRIAERRLYEVVDMAVINNSVYDITLQPAEKHIRYKAGQFIFISFFNKKVGRESHPFSIASSSGSRTIRIVVKNLGDFTGKLSMLKKGDKAIIEGPYGSFNSGSDRSQIWLAGGIGITPFIGMAEDIGESTKKKIDLVYTVRDDKEFVYLDDFRSISRKYPNFKVITKITNKSGYLTVKEVLDLIGDAKDREIYICGPEPFKESMKKGFLAVGTPMERIHWEDFNFR